MHPSKQQLQKWAEWSDIPDKEQTQWMAQEILRMQDQYEADTRLLESTGKLVLRELHNMGHDHSLQDNLPFGDDACR